MADITLVQQAEKSSNGTTSCSLTLRNCTVGNTLILAYVIRGNGNNPTLTDGWEKIGGGNVDADAGDTHQKLYFAKKKVENTTETIKLKQTTTGRIYLVCGEFIGDFDIAMRDDMANIGSGDYKVTANKNNATDVILYGVTSSSYPSGNVRAQKCEPNDLTKLQGDKEERLACWFDNGNGALSHTFTIATISGSSNIAIVECVQLIPNIPNKPKYLIRNNDIIYTVQNDSLVEVIGDLNAQLFIDNGVDTIPDGSLLMTLSNPEVLCWTNAEKLPTLTATVKGIPEPQIVMSKEIDLMHSSIKGINGVTVDCNGNVLFAVSFDKKATWLMHNGTEWVAVSDELSGMTKTEFEAITTEQWQPKYEASSDMYIRCMILDETQSITALNIDFIN